MRQEMEQRMKEAEANRRTVEYRIFYGDYQTLPPASRCRRESSG